MAEFVSCGFVRSYILLATTLKNSSEVYDWIIDNIGNSLSSIELPAETKKVKQKLKDYVAFIRKRKLSAKYRSQLVESFPITKWRELTKENQRKHTFSNCKVSQFIKKCN